MNHSANQGGATLVYLFWSLPILTVFAVIASGRASSAQAGFWGLTASITVAVMSDPMKFGAREAIVSIMQGAWLALLVGTVILGGLFFREVVSATSLSEQPALARPEMRRHHLYTACFFLGPFAEAATGFGVGQTAIAPMLKSIGIAPVYAVIFGLFSQIMVPWGASANGTIVGAELAGLSPSDLGYYSALLTLPLLLGWLCLFWRFAAAAGVPGTAETFLAEAVLTIIAGSLLILANIEFGPEVAAMVALGPFIALRYFLGGETDREHWRSAIRIGLPYVALISGVAATRAIHPLNQFLASAIVIKPFTDGPKWLPLLHPGSWLLGVGLMTALIMSQPSNEGTEC